MEGIEKLIKFSKDLEEEKPMESAYWHLQQLRKEMRKALNIQSVSCFYTLKEGDEIKQGDEYYNEQDEWKISDVVGEEFTPATHYRHRRNNCN